MAASVLPSLVVFLMLGFLAQSQATVCPTNPDVSLCVGGEGADANGCCTDHNPDCCDRDPLGKYCHISESDSPCCMRNETVCSFPFAECFPIKDLCDGKCCGNPDDDGYGVCCGKTCCSYSTSKCLGTKCGDVCTRTVNGKLRKRACREPKFCCQGRCVDPVKGNPALPCNGLCCETPDGFKFGPVKNGICCKGQCCVDEQKCVKGKCV